VEALLQHLSCFFSQSIKLRGLPLSAVTVSLHYLPRCLRSTVPCRKTLIAVISKLTSEDLLPRYCYAIQNNSRTFRSQVSQPTFPGKWTDMNELQAHRCKGPEQWMNLTLVQWESTANKLSLQKLNQSIGIKLLTGCLLEILAFFPISKGGQMPVLLPAVDAHGNGTSCSSPKP